MNEVATYIRCQINGKWTNLGLIAEEGEIQEHFEFIEGLLKEKQRADELEKRWSELKDYLEERIETSKVDCEDNKYIYSRYKTCKNTLFKMQRLEENNNA